MAALYITEYVELGRDPNGQPIQAGVEPAVATQVVAIGGVSAALTNPLNAKTRFVRLQADAVCSYKFGPSASVAATANDARLPANVVEYIAVNQSSVAAGMKVACITNT